MMNGAKKSHSSIVPAKLANKAERSAAELVEGDDGTERNAELQSTVRTQSWEAVTQAQARIRGAVTRNKKEKLTALLHHVSMTFFRYHTGIIWFRSLRRRSQRHRLTWERMVRLIKRFLPSPRVLHLGQTIGSTSNTRGRSRVR